ncbi:MAG: hypothetical protein ACRD2I_11050 [Vicinamibacterales bacterium]
MRASSPALTPVAFSRLLAWLDDGVDSDGERYLEIRRRLVAYFDRRNRPSPDDLADETFNRIGRTLKRHGRIAVAPPVRYCYVVAKFVLLDDVRRGQIHVSLDERRIAVVAAGRVSGQYESGRADAIDERRLEQLDRCLQGLKPADRELVVEYYRDTRRRKIECRRGLAKRLGITMNALSIRACRIRRALEGRVDACCQEGMTTSC